MEDRDARPPVHERCTEHTHKCENIKRLQEENERQDDMIEKKVSTKVMLSVMGIMTSLFLGLFVVSINMNQGAIEQVNDAAKDRKEQLVQVFRTQSEMTKSVAVVGAKVDELSRSMEDVKEELKEMRRGRGHE